MWKIYLFQLSLLFSVHALENNEEKGNIRIEDMLVLCIYWKNEMRMKWRIGEGGWVRFTLLAVLIQTMCALRLRTEDKQT